jgi:predicted RNA-binding protein with PIN domain
MQYIIDGHNLIPNIRGLTLSDLDDEQALIDLLTPFLRAKKSRAMVFFDRAGTGLAGQRNFGLIKAVFVPAGQTADSAIANYIRQIKGASQNHTLVSSDRAVQASARSYHAMVLTSQEFSKLLQIYYEGEPQAAPAERELSPEKVKQWEDLFNQYGSQPPDGMSP